MRHRRGGIAIALTVLLAAGLWSLAPLGFYAPTSAAGSAPTTPPSQICGDTSLLSGPASAPAGSVTVPAGDDSTLAMSNGSHLDANYEMTPGTTYWFAPGTHTLSTSQYDEIQPANDDVFVGAPGAVLDGQGDNQSAFAYNSQQSPSGTATIEYLTIEDFTGGVGENVVNANDTANWTVDHNTIKDTTVGAALGMGNNNVAEYNCLTANGEYGLNAGGSNTTFDYNEVSWNGSYSGYFPNSTACSGCSGGIKYWASLNPVIEDNYIHDNYNVGLWLDTNNAGALIEGNYLARNWSDGLIYEISYNALITANTFLDNGWSASDSAAGNVLGDALYVSESGGNSAVDSDYKGSFTVSDNVFTDNWDGVVVYQNSDRACSNNYTTDCTLTDPSVYTNSSCSANFGSSTPSGNPDYYDGCQWKAQNITVEDNTFNFNPSDIINAKPTLPDETPANCASSNFLGTNAAPPDGNEYYCGFNGMYGFTGSHAPLGGTWTVENALMDLPNANGEAADNNHWLDNTYNGPWSFQAYSQGTGTQNGHDTEVDLSDWQSLWGQD
jgi:hypothetical protein